MPGTKKHLELRLAANHRFERHEILQLLTSVLVYYLYRADETKIIFVVGLRIFLMINKFFDEIEGIARFI